MVHNEGDGTKASATEGIPIRVLMPSAGIQALRELEIRNPTKSGRPLAHREHMAQNPRSNNMYQEEPNIESHNRFEVGETT